MEDRKYRATPAPGRGYSVEQLCKEFRMPPGKLKLGNIQMGEEIWVWRRIEFVERWEAIPAFIRAYELGIDERKRGCEWYYDGTGKITEVKGSVKAP